VTSTSVTAATSLLFTVAIGFLAAALVAPTEGEARRPRGTRPVKATESEHKLDDLMMENSK
jgi:gas vesicle protein